MIREPSLATRRLYLGALLVLSLTLKIIFLFKFSHYQHHLMSDMGGFWDRANDRYHGEIFAIGQWLIVPVFYHLFLFQIFKIADFFGVFHYRLEIILVLSALFSTLSVYFVYKIAKDLTHGFRRAFAASALYAFCYPIIYFNTLVLSENLGIPLLILVTYLVFTFHASKRWMLLAGLLLGAAVSARLVFGIMGLVFFVYLCFGNKFSRRSVFCAVCFAAAFWGVMFFLIAENLYVSKGELKGLASYQGFNVFMQFCKPHNAISHYPGYGGEAYSNNPVFFDLHPEYGDFHTDRPFHDRDYYFKLGMDCMRSNPGIWMDNLKVLKGVFTGPLFPTFKEVAGYSWGISLFQRLTLFLSLSIGLFYACIRRGISPSGAKITVLLAPFFCTLLTGYFFTLEPRYLIPCLYGFYIVFFAMLPRLIEEWKKSILYYSGLLCIFLVFHAQGELEKKHWMKTFGTEQVRKFPLERAGKVSPDGTPGNQWGMFIMPTAKSAILLESKMPRSANQIEISTDSWDSYRVEFYLNERRLGEIFLPLEQPPAGGTFKRNLPMPESLKGKPFNQILVSPVQGDGVYSLAYLLLDPDVSRAKGAKA